MELTASKPQGNNFANCPPYLCHQGLQSQMSPQNVKGGKSLGGEIIISGSPLSSLGGKDRKVYVLERRLVQKKWAVG